MIIKVNREEQFVRLVWESSFDEVYVRAFAQKHNLTVDENILTIHASFEGLRLLSEFLYSSTSDALAQKILANVKRLLGEGAMGTTSHGIN